MNDKILDTITEILNANPKCVVSVCYGTAIIFASKATAKRFYLNGMMCSEGCERERYESIYIKLNEGMQVANDDMDDWQEDQLNIRIVDISVREKLKQAETPVYWHGEKEIS